jgi:NADH-quinone oxidoreductase subunit B
MPLGVNRKKAAEAAEEAAMKAKPTILMEGLLR